MAKQDVDRAIAQYEKALTLRPEDPNAHYNLGVALQEKGETERAAREYEKAREFEPRG
jgi:Flp pilus assembly protein TadD